MRSFLAYWILLIIGSVVGLLLTIIHIGFYEHLFGVPKKDSWDDKQVAILACATFFGTLYNVGIYGYKWLGMNQEAEKEADDKKWQMYLINATAVIIVICSWFSSHGSPGK